MIIIFLLFICIIIYLLHIKYTENFDTLKIKKLLCFLIYDKINNEELWYDFFKKIDKSKYSIYIHYKDNKKLNYFEDHKIKSIKY